MPRSSTLLAALAVLSVLPAGGARAQDVPEPAMDTVMAALSRGYGAMCSLSNEPVPDGQKGYYRCVDMAPYRFVAAYGKIVGYVVVQGAAPYPILESDSHGRDARFLAKGPWMSHLDAQVAAWWSDEVEGGRARREAETANSKQARDAEAEVRKYMPPDEPPAGVPPQGAPEGAAGLQPPAAIGDEEPGARAEPGVAGIMPEDPNGAPPPGSPYPKGFRPAWLGDGPPKR